MSRKLLNATLSYFKYMHSLFRVCCEKAKIYLCQAIKFLKTSLNCIFVNICSNIYLFVPDRGLLFVKTNFWPLILN